MIISLYFNLIINKNELPIYAMGSCQNPSFVEDGTTAEVGASLEATKRNLVRIRSVGSIRSTDDSLNRGPFNFIYSITMNVC